MAWTAVQRVNQTTTGSITFASTTAGNLLIIVAGCSSATALTAPAGWTNVATIVGGTISQIVIFANFNNPGGITSVTISGGASPISVSGAEYTCPNVSSLSAASASNTGTANKVASITVTNGAGELSGDLVIVGATQHITAAAVTWTNPSGVAAIGTLATASAAQHTYAGDDLSGTGASQAATVTSSVTSTSNSSWTGAVASFTQPAAPVTGVRQPTRSSSSRLAVVRRQQSQGPPQAQMPLATPVVSQPSRRQTQQVGTRPRQQQKVPGPGWINLQSASHGMTNSSTVAATYSNNVQANTKLIAWVVGVWGSGTATISSVKDGAGNTFTLVPGANPSSGALPSIVAGCFTLDTPAGDVGTKPTITATFGQTISDGSILIQEVSGLATGDAHDGTPGTSIAAGAASIGQPAYTDGARGEYLTTFFADTGTSETFTAPTGYTLDTSSINTSGVNDLAVAYKSSTGGAESGTWTFTGSTTANDAFIVVAFKLAGSAAAVAAPATLQQPRNSSPRLAAARRQQSQAPSQGQRPLAIPSPPAQILPRRVAVGAQPIRRAQLVPPVVTVPAATPVLRASTRQLRAYGPIPNRHQTQGPIAAPSGFPLPLYPDHKPRTPVALLTVRKAATQPVPLRLQVSGPIQSPSVVSERRFFLSVRSRFRQPLPVPSPAQTLRVSRLRTLFGSRPRTQSGFIKTTVIVAPPVPNPAQPRKALWFGVKTRSQSQLNIFGAPPPIAANPPTGLPAKARLLWFRWRRQGQLNIFGAPPPVVAVPRPLTKLRVTNVQQPLHKPMQFAPPTPILPNKTTVTRRTPAAPRLSKPTQFAPPIPVLPSKSAVTRRTPAAPRLSKPTQRIIPQVPPPLIPPTGIRQRVVNFLVRLRPRWATSFFTPPPPPPPTTGPEFAIKQWRQRWVFQIDRRWAILVVTARWRVHVAYRMSSLATEYIPVDVTAAVAGVVTNPTSFAVQNAVVAAGSKPIAPTFPTPTAPWVAGAWLAGTVGNTFINQFLAGPNPSGEYDIWIAIQSSPEIVVEKAGTLEVY